ncbi:MAG TPA: hypothetical protein VE546_19730 [Streptomyces sp.]|nr:hypothetical protein [Streptomyces sp.]HZG05774.1 hypothetical protein [Streptomyces sp.]
MTHTRCSEPGYLIRANDFEVDDELWAVDASDCSPCDNKVPDSH